jgi:hypothetical protein
MIYIENLTSDKMRAAFRAGLRETTRRSLFEQVADYWVGGIKADKRVSLAGVVSDLMDRGITDLAQVDARTMRELATKNLRAAK